MSKGPSLFRLNTFRPNNYGAHSASVGFDASESHLQRGIDPLFRNALDWR